MYAAHAAVLRGGVRSGASACTSKRGRWQPLVLTVGRRQASTKAGPPTSSHMPFRSTTKFKLTPAQVNETNVPSAREVAQMIPTLRELQAQLPDALALEQRYIRPENVVAPAPESASTADAADDNDFDGAGGKPSTTPFFVKTTDPLEDLLFGPPKEEGTSAETTTEEDKRPRRQHLLLAYRALLWGTAYALLGVGATVAGAMYLCGYHNLGELLDGVRGKARRDEDRLRGCVAVDDAASSVEHFVIDLTHPAEAWRQLQEVWSAVQRLAEEEDAKTQKSVPL
ncbi:putative mitochondrial hypothetical protein [Leptomonas pyrrhocoris]|uniref:Uncharacterized protein n=1 Tax=Leptomonas pyrrhocoris TaxID=157538 RepID=A0A0N0VHW4_LEPPY|nr:putative mitochondrial hypothetical protein [Leptomonas pyrrhocoris]XP_015665193.1 putative mitochondrial hypothetical protein [Leptomonas pyrrhocoris]XP_015665194.1 putative mitochondrial hypothetical protein [Leptomonas pyrrhocoris]KPA86753.1 putative mitochondrial hypothetical protein [Leptomonas pyrrhocoris]KPA86754.1 putative mitochondrial hypothetical protein [Leptomonas pyrrhocoris]KPA86755.1 putative mitochondrial hypothetical protein [Leptomonas pyrrhocoris]|eukprot:XP_015665192.1 putative mitochondrial hypothetical protein [Leptomonas pyrrhocoris]